MVMRHFFLFIIFLCSLVCSVTSGKGAQNRGGSASSSAVQKHRPLSHRKRIRPLLRKKPRIPPPKTPTPTPAPQPYLENLGQLRLPNTPSLFSSLKRALHPNWILLLVHQDIPTTSSRSQMAMIIGILMTNGYVAVEAQDGQEVKNIGRDILTLAKSLGINQRLLPQINHLIDVADGSDWDGLRHGLEQTQQDLKKALLEQQDENLVGLMTITSWLRANQLMVDILDQYYQRSLAGIVYQPNIYERIAVEMKILPQRIGSDPLVIQLQKGVAALGKLEENHAAEFHQSKGLKKGAIAELKQGLEKIVLTIIPLPAPAPKPTPNTALTPIPAITGTNSSIISTSSPAMAPVHSKSDFGSDTGRGQ